MLAFTAEEFNIMLDQLLYNQQVSFDMLIQIAEKTLRSSVKRWCNTDEALAGKGFEEDILQEVYIRLVKTAVSSFFLRNGVDGPVNNDMDGFKNWMFKVAVNIKRDYANQVRKVSAHTYHMEEGEAEKLLFVSDALSDPATEREQLLSKAFAIVLDADVQVYKVLTWMAQSLYIVEQDVTKIQSNGLVVEHFSQKTLFEMRDILFGWTEKVSWLQITADQRAKIEQALVAADGDGNVYGEMRYSEFFMKKGGKATISDWVNRMNHLIKRETANETLNS